MSVAILAGTGTADGRLERRGDEQAGDRFEAAGGPWNTQPLLGFATSRRWHGLPSLARDYLGSGAGPGVGVTDPGAVAGIRSGAADFACTGAFVEGRGAATEQHEEADPAGTTRRERSRPVDAISSVLRSHWLAGAARAETRSRVLWS